MATDDSDSEREDGWMSQILMEGEEENKMEINLEPNRTAQIMEEDNMIGHPTKRGREDDEEESWTKVERDRGKKHKLFKKEVFIWSKQKLPKQFAIAKLFKSMGLVDINHIKYINPYKLKIEASTEQCVSKLLDCQEFQTREWKVYSAMDVNISYGIIRDVDLELSDEEVLQAIKCPNEVQIVSLKRLQRREDGGWVSSEAAKVGFRGSHLPSFVYVDCLRVKVEPFVFPVTQCSNCWKFGHVKLRCTLKKIVCPKCTEEHSNCEVTSFKCVNCRGEHMALNRNCPVYARERRVRELMAEYNCTYHVACNMYVRPKMPNDTLTSRETEKPKIDTNNTYSGLCLQETGSSGNSNSFPPLFTRSRPESPRVSHSNRQSHLQNLKNKKEYFYAPKGNTELRGHRKSPDRIPKQPTDNDVGGNVNNTREVHLDELIRRLKDIIYMRNRSIQDKFYDVIKCCSKWLVLVLVDRIPEWPILNKCLELFYGILE